MPFLTFTRRDFLAVAGFAGLPSAKVFAQPSELIRIVNGAPAGGALDALCRQVAEHLQPGYARNAVVENRTGAGGQIAASFVKQASPDGQTILCTPMPQLGIFPHTYKSLPYDPVNDFAPVSMGATFDLALAVGPAVPESIRTARDFLQWCKTNPAKANFGSPAAGSTPHFVGALLGKAANVKLNHIPFRGTPPAIADMLGGHVEAVVSGVGDFLPFLADGKCRLLATTGARRSPFAPAVATLIEQGFAGMEFTDWFGFFVPAKTPSPQVERLNAAIRTALSRDEVGRALALRGIEVRSSSPPELGESLRADFQRWGPLVKSIGFTAES